MKQQKAMARESKSIDKLYNQRAVLEQKREDCNRKIHDLGTLPADQLKKYVRLFLCLFTSVSRAGSRRRPFLS